MSANFDIPDSHILAISFFFYTGNFFLFFVAQLFVDKWLKEKPLSAINQELEYKNERWAKTTGLTLDSDLEVHESPADCVDILRSKWLPQGELHEPVMEVNSGEAFLRK